MPAFHAPLRPRLVLPSSTVAVAALLLALALSGCNRASGEKGGASGGPPPAPVTIATVHAASVPVVFEYVGQLAGARDAEVRARVAGILLKRNFSEGSAVKKGQSLYQLDAAPFRAALAKADADVAAARARLDQAGRTLARLKPLAESGMVSKRDLDDAIANEQVVRADLQRAQAQRAEDALKLSYTLVEAPIAGVAGRSLVSEGTLVQGAQLLLTTVTQSDPMKVRFGIAATDQQRWRSEAAAGQLRLPANEAFDVELQLADGSTYARRGKLVFSDTRISTSTGTIDAEAVVANPEGLLKPGQFVRVRLLGAVRPAAVKVPTRAVLEGPQGKFVYLAVGGKAMPKPVVVGEQQADGWILQQGLAEGDSLIVDGMARIFFPGAPIQAAPAPASAATSAPASAPAGQ